MHNLNQNNPKKNKRQKGCTSKNKTLLLGVLLFTVFGIPLQGCVAIGVGAVLAAGTGTTLVTTDPRTSGVQIDDETIELRGMARLQEQFGQRLHFNATSYAGHVLLTGEIASDLERKTAAQAISSIAGVRRVTNELVVSDFSSSLTKRTTDTLTTARIKASLLAASDVASNHFKVVTENNVVYLMGKTNQKEGRVATQIAQNASGVARVVLLFDVV